MLSEENVFMAKSYTKIFPSATLPKIRHPLFQSNQAQVFEF